jgi:integrase
MRDQRLRFADCRRSVKPAGFHVLRHTSASLYVMAGVPLQVVAKNLGHADTRMTEKHFAHLAPSYVAEQIRSRAPTFGTVEASSVVSIANTRG